MKTTEAELTQKMDFSIIRYANVWEDLGLLRTGLGITESDHVLSVTSGGDNALGLLLFDPASVTAIDLSPAQNHLMELKTAAIRRLDYEEFIGLLGMTRHADPITLFDAVAPALSPGALAFWEENTDLIESGVLGQGRLEKQMGLLPEE